MKAVGDSPAFSYPIATISLKDFDEENRRCELCVFSSPDQEWNAESQSAAIREVLGKAFGEFGTRKACSYVFAGHAEGVRLLPGSGFLVEAILRDEACDLGAAAWTCAGWRSRVGSWPGRLVTAGSRPSKALGDTPPERDTPQACRGLLISYTSPTIIGCAIFLLLFFSRLELRRLVPFVRFFAPLSFGAYLLHEEPHVREHLIAGSFAWYAQLNPLLMCVAVLATALGIWFVGSMVDFARARLFDLLHVGRLCDWLGGHMDRLLGNEGGMRA